MEHTDGLLSLDAVVCKSLLSSIPGDEEVAALSQTCRFIYQRVTENTSRDGYWKERLTYLLGRGVG